MSEYVRNFDETKNMSFLIKECVLLQKFNEISAKVSNIIKIKWKTKIKSHEGKIDTIFLDEKIPKESFHCICLLVLSIDSVFKIDKNYYSQIYFKECKYVVRKKSKKNVIDNIEISSDEPDNKVTDKGYFDIKLLEIFFW